MHRLGLLALVVPLFCLAAARAGDDEKKKPDPGNGQEKGKDNGTSKVVLPPARPTTVALELKDGTTLQAEWVGPPMLAFTTMDLGPLRFKRESVRYIDLEGAVNRLGTHELEMFYGTLDTSVLDLKLIATGDEHAIPVDRIRRIFMPERPRVYTVP